MHNLAIALSRKGLQVTGSDDAIFDPSKSRLEREGLMPEELGWHPDRITPETQAVIVGMHAREDNPELARASQLGVATYSYPEYLYNATQDKQRTVIGGSHGKTSTTAMILHVLNSCGKQPDYMVGAQLEGFDCMVKLTDQAQGVVLEGDEYLASPLDRRPKFHLYRPHIAVLTGVAWDHVNVFPTWDIYVEQFRIFIETIEKQGVLIYSQDDETLRSLAEKASCRTIPYGAHPHHIENGYTYLHTDQGDVRIEIFGEHNLMNLSAALHVCEAWGIARNDFYQAISTFTGASRRLETLGRNAECIVYQDFAHSPSKVEATTQAVKAQFPERTLVAALELHTFSSLSAEFLAEYKGTMDAADVAFVAFNPEAVAHKRLPAISAEDVQKGFKRDDLRVFTHPAEMMDALLELERTSRNVLIMSSGDLGGRDIHKVAADLLK